MLFGMARGRKLPISLTRDEAAALVQQARSRRDRLILLIGLLAGLRVAEIVALRREHVNLEKREILIFCGKGSKQRVVPIHRRLFDPLRQWLHVQGSDWLFPSKSKAGRPLTRRAVQLMIQLAAERAGVSKPGRKHVGPHMLRHTLASTLLDRNVDLVTIKELLGHESLSTTARYVHIATEKMRSALEELN